MKLGERYKQLKTDLEMAEALYDRWDTGEIAEYIRRDYSETSVEVLEALLDAHPKLWEMVNSLENYSRLFSYLRPLKISQSARDGLSKLCQSFLEKSLDKLNYFCYNKYIKGKDDKNYAAYKMLLRCLSCRGLCRGQ